MCDHCVKRERAYNAASPDVRDAADRLTAQVSADMITAMMTGQSPEDFEPQYIAYGDNLDMLLGIASAPQVPDSPPDWL